MEDVPFVLETASTLRQEFLMWDPSARVKCALSAASMPMKLSATSANANFKGNWEAYQF